MTNPPAQQDVYVHQVWLELVKNNDWAKTTLRQGQDKRARTVAHHTEWTLLEGVRHVFHDDMACDPVTVTVNTFEESSTQDGNLDATIWTIPGSKRFSDELRSCALVKYANNNSVSN